jgi:hypothetical protein
MIGAEQQTSSVAAPSAAAVDLDECLSEPWNDLEVLRAVSAAVPAHKRREVLAILMASCAGNDA